jgi:hypothetical protein
LIRWAKFDNLSAVRGVERGRLDKAKRPKEELHDCAFYCILILRVKPKERGRLGDIGAQGITVFR